MISTCELKQELAAVPQQPLYIYFLLVGEQTFVNNKKQKGVLQPFFELPERNFVGLSVKGFLWFQTKNFHWKVSMKIYRYSISLSYPIYASKKEKDSNGGRRLKDELTPSRYINLTLKIISSVSLYLQNKI